VERIRVNRYQKLNKYERSAQQKELLESRIRGEGLYVFKNHTKGELMLPKPTASGKRRLAVDEEFQGDSYFMGMVKSNMLILVREITSIAQDRVNKLEEKTVAEQKLLLDQPDRVTNAGKTEHVVVEQKPAVKLNEEKKNGKPQVVKEALLNEGPAGDMSGIEIIN
jgi:hypothetical protein